MFKEKIMNHLLKIVRYIILFNWSVYEMIFIHNSNVYDVAQKICPDGCREYQMAIDTIKTGNIYEGFVYIGLIIYSVLLIFKCIKTKKIRDCFIDIVELALNIVIVLLARVTLTGEFYNLGESILLKKFIALLIILLIAGFIYDRARIKKINN